MHPIHLAVLVCDQPADVADRFAIALLSLLQFGLQPVGALTQRGVAGDVGSVLSDQIQKPLMDAGPSGAFSVVRSVLSFVPVPR